MPATTGLNGTAPPPPDREEVKEVLVGDALTTGYRPTLPLWALWTTEAVPQFHLLRDIELMMIHPVVLNNLNYFKSGVAGAEFEVDGDPPDMAEWAMKQCQKFWDRGVPKVQGGYEYGWMGMENLFVEDTQSLLAWDDVLQFSPRDVFLLTLDAVPAGVRVKQIRAPGLPERSRGYQSGRGQVDLWLASEDVPAKGLWYAHRPRYSQFYGQSQLLGAWRPWRRLAWKDGAETVIDGGVYRFAYAGPVVWYPEEDRQAAGGPGSPGSPPPATSQDSQGRSRRYARDAARQIAELYKTGAGVGLPSSKYPPELGGGKKWEFELPKSTLAVNGLIDYAKYLQDQISYGVGVPPELLQASETGSGYSGRAIPLEGFLMQQQWIADAMLALFVAQVLRPLVRWNWGPGARFEAKVRNLIQTKRQAQTGKEGGMPANQGLQGEARQPGQPPGPELPTGGGMPGEGYDPNWKAYTNPSTGKVGWISDRGRVVYSDMPPGTEAEGFSLDRVRAIAIAALSAGRVA